MAVFQVLIGSTFKKLTVGPHKLSGGEGWIWFLSGKQSGKDYVLKVYKKEDTAKKKESKILYLIKAKPPEVNPKFVRFCWPLLAVYTEDCTKFCGYIMQKAFDGSRDMQILTWSPLSTIREISNKDVDWYDKFELNTTDGLRRRMQILEHWVMAINALHKTNKYILGDIKCENVLVTPKGEISIIDIDNCQVICNDNQWFEISAKTANYFPPEAVNLYKEHKKLDYSCDSFAIGCCIYQVLVGCHPYSNFILKAPYDGEDYCKIEDKIRADLYYNGALRNYIQPVTTYNAHENRKRLTNQLCHLFDRTFRRTTVRPTLKEWRDALHSNIIILKTLKTNH